MKHILIILAALLLLPPVGNTQGLIGLGNSALTRITVADGTPTGRAVTATDGLRIQIWVGPAGTQEGQLSLLPGTENIGIGTTAGVLSGPSLSAYPLAGYDGGTTVSLQIRGILSNGGLSLEGKTKVAQVQLTSAPSAGAVIWQTASGTNPNRFTPLVIVPEPSTLALGALGGLMLLCRARGLLRR